MAVNIGKAKFKQKRTSVTVSGLLAYGFIRTDNIFNIGDLQVFLLEGYFYYISDKFKYIRIENEYTLAKMVYGKTPYSSIA